MNLKRKVNLFLKLSIKQKCLLFLVLLLLGLMRVAILLIPFRIITRWLLKPRHSANRVLSITVKKHGYARTIGRIVAGVAKFTPWESKCLVQSLTCRVLLRWWSIPNTFFIGVGKDEKAQFIAHAWVNCGLETIVGGSNSLENYKIIAQFEDN